MNRQDLLWRLAGVISFAGAGGASLLHREVLARHAAGPATGLEALLGLLSFALACTGALLIARGARCRGDWLGPRDPAPRKNIDSSRSRPASDPAREVPHFSARDPFALGSGRAAILVHLAECARRRSLERASSWRHRPPEPKE